jgi:hypothetical protein
MSYPPKPLHTGFGVEYVTIIDAKLLGVLQNCYGVFLPDI